MFMRVEASNCPIREQNMRAHMNQTGTPNRTIIAITGLLGIVATVLMAVPSLASAQVDADDPRIANPVHQTVSCLAGNGRVDFNIVNTSGGPATYRLEYEGLTPRQRTLDPMDWWRVPVTGRADGDADVVVTRDRAIIVSNTITVACDTTPPVITETEVEVISACRGSTAARGYLLIQIANATNTAKPYVIEFEGVPNRSTTAAAYGQAVRAVTGRKNGTYNVTVKSSGVIIHSQKVAVNCSEPLVVVTPPPRPTPLPEVTPTPPPVIAPSLPIPDPADDLGVSPGRPGISPPGGGGEIPVQAGLLTAADIDDNLNLDFFASYVERSLQNDADQILPQVTVSDRITIALADSEGRPLSNAKLDIGPQGDTVATTFANAAGIVRLFPTEIGVPSTGVQPAVVTDAATGTTTNISLDFSDLDTKRKVDVLVPNTVASLPKGLDVAFVIDTTGSMGDELSYLKAEFAAIVSAVRDREPTVDMRFGLVVYRDIGDEYVTRVYDFATATDMLDNLARQAARGGGDYPEAMEAALNQAAKLSWRNGDVSRVAILNADAPPHDENLQAALDAAEELRLQGVRIHSLAASGVADTAEYLMRTMAVTTGGRHLFLTDDSGVGGAHQEPKVQCFVVTRLDQLLVRVLESELAGERIEPSPDDIIRTTGEYDNGTCLGPQPLPVSQLIGKANFGGEVIDPRTWPIDSFEIAESFPEQITIVFGASPAPCLAANATATAIDGEVFLALEVGYPAGPGDIACSALIVEHRLTIQLTEGLLGRTVVTRPIAL